MRKIFMLALLISILMGVALPATASPVTALGGFNINNAIGVQEQIAIPISIAVFGSNGPQGVGQFQEEDFWQKIKY